MERRMPKDFEKKLTVQADKKGLTGDWKKAYVFGAMKKAVLKKHGGIQGMHSRPMGRKG